MMKNYAKNYSSKIVMIVLIFTGFSKSVLAQPTITNFLPKRGGVGTTITITGTNFSATPANNIVYFGAVSSPVLTANATTLTVKVPAGASYKRISVTVAGMTGWARETFLPTFAGTGVIGNNTLEDNVDFPALPVSNANNKLEIVDFDGDMKPDIVSLNSGKISFFRNTSSPGSIGPASLAPKYDYNTTLSPGSTLGEIESFTFSDVDNDGKKDLVFIRKQVVTEIDGGLIYLNLEMDLAIVMNQSVAGSINASSFGQPVFWSIYGFSPFNFSNHTGNLEAADINLDGREDFLYTQTGNNPMGHLMPMNLSQNSSYPYNYYYHPTYQHFNIASAGKTLLFDNINTDNKPEFICNGYVYTNNWPPGVSLIYPNFVNIGISNTPDYSVDFDFDGKKDYYVGGLVRQNNVTGSIIDNTSFATGFTVGRNSNDPAGFGDINGDGTIDICQLNDSNATVNLIPNIYSGSSLSAASFGATTVFDSLSGTPLDALVHDIDLDGKPDVVFYNSNSSISIMRNNCSSLGAALTLGTISASAGTIASVPVTTSALSDIEGFQFTVSYDPTKLSYQNSSNWNSGIDAAKILITNNSNTGKITFIYNDQAFNTSNGVFFNLNFNVISSNQGNTSLTWGDNPTPREFIDAIPNIIPVTYSDGSVALNSATGVKEEMLKNDVSLYPNPATASFRIVGIKSGIKNVEIFNAIGKKIYSKALNIQNEQISCKDFPAGVYLVNVYNGDRVYTHKLIIEM